MGLNLCFAKEAERADGKMKETYQHYLSILSGENRERLIAAQNAWLQYREAECKAVAGAYEGGSMEPMQSAACYLSLNTQRAKELHMIYVDIE